MTDPATPETGERCVLVLEVLGKPVKATIPDYDGAAELESQVQAGVRLGMPVGAERVVRYVPEAELTALRERDQLESAVVETLIAERTARDAIPALSLKQGEFPSQEFWNANHHLENVHIDTEKALDALLAHRAQKGT